MIGRSPDIEGTRSVAGIHCEDALESGMIGRSPDIEGTRSVTEIHCEDALEPGMIGRSPDIERHEVLQGYIAE